MKISAKIRSALAEYLVTVPGTEESTDKYRRLLRELRCHKHYHHATYEVARELIRTALLDPNTPAHYYRIAFTPEHFRTPDYKEIRHARDKVAERLRASRR